MKKLLVLFLVSALSTGAFAQNHKMDTTHKMKSGQMMKEKDCVYMEDGKMMMMKNGHTMEMSKDMKMSNGTMVMKDGTVKMKDGKTMMMKDGDKIDMKGHMSKMKMDKMKNHKM